jgi:hypothetical protein
MGGGVRVNRGGVFTMNDGSITGNRAHINGGGVFVAGVFTMNGGRILNNTAHSNGGGVFVVENSGTFTKTGGVIEGVVNDQENGNRVRDNRGFVENSGHAVFVRSNMRKETTSTSGNNMMYNGTNGTFSGEWDF